MSNWYEEATWTCPICDYTLFGNEPALHVICHHCKKDKKEDDEYDPNGLHKAFTDRYND